MIDNRWIVFVKINVDCASELFCCGFSDENHFFLRYFEDFIAIASHGTVEHAIIWHHIVGIATVELSDGEDEILPRVNISRFNQVEVLHYRGSTRYHICEIMRNRTVPTLSLDNHLDTTYRCHHWSFLNTDLSLPKIRHIMHSIDFIDTIKATFLYHRESTPWPLLCWLEKKTDAAIVRELFLVFLKKTSSHNERGRVSIVATHVSIFCFACIREAWVDFFHL